MKGLKKLSLLALGLLFVAGVASCTSNKNGDNSGNGGDTVDPTVDPDDPTEDTSTVIPDYVEMEDLESDKGSLSTLSQPDNYPGVYVNDENKLQYRLANLKIYTEKDRSDLARVVFYLGEEFNYDNLLVLATFNKLDEEGNTVYGDDGKPVTIIAKINNYQVDSSAIDTSVMGTYTAQVNYRYGETVKAVTYTVTVRSSEFETTKNLVYIAGVKAGYKDSVATDYFKLKNEGRIVTTYVQKNGNNNFSLDVSQLNLQLVKNTVNAVASAFTTEYLDFDTSSLTNDTTNKKMHNSDNTFVIDYSAVNTGKVGSYIVPINYNAGNITVGNRTVENKVQAFIVVDVINPVIQIINSNEYSVEASMSLPDFTAYTVIVQRQCLNGTTLAKNAESVTLTNDLFTFENFVPYNQGKQNVNFVLKEACENGTYASFNSEVTVTASTKYNISVVTNMTNGTVIEVGETTDKKKIYKQYQIDSYTTAYTVDAINAGDKSRTCLADGMAFDGFLKLDTLAKSSYIEFTFTEDTTLIIYVGSNGDDDRGFALYNSANEAIYEEVASSTESGAKQTPVRRAYELKAGTYRVAATGSTVTFHGYIIGVEK